MKVQEGQFVDGREDGHWTNYDASGHVIEVIEYEKGRVVRRQGPDSAQPGR